MRGKGRVCVCMCVPAAAAARLGRPFPSTACVAPYAMRTALGVVSEMVAASSSLVSRGAKKARPSTPLSTPLPHMRAPPNASTNQQEATGDALAGARFVPRVQSSWGWRVVMVS